jgi:ATP-dependent DNA helicase PIF1
LINKLQCHTRCNSSYCLRVDRTGHQYCRFGYPKDPTEDTYLRDDNGQPELITARNDPLVNPHDRLQLQGWRANVDLKPVLTMNVALRYVSKYASKSEPRSASFSEILSTILRNSDPSDSSLKAIQGLLLHTVAERDISAQETCHLLLELPLYRSSRQFVSLNLNKNAHRWICGSGTSPFSSDEDVSMTVQSPLQKYWNRPAELEDLSLFQLFLKYRYCKGQWKLCERENIVRVWSRPLTLRDGPQWEDFCQVKVLLHITHRDLGALTENSSVSWFDLFERYCETIENAPSDLLGPPVDNLENDVDDESDQDCEDLDDIENEDGVRPDWMVLSEMRPDAEIEISSDLGFRDID